MIRQLTIKNFLALQALTVEIGPDGAIVEGGNGRGKTTVLKALKAGLDGAGISPEAVRKGEGAAEILIDLGHDTVRRRITAAGGTTLEVTNDVGTRKKPAAWLSELLGLALLDPLDLLLAKPAERREIVTRAVPCKLTPEMVADYVPADLRNDVPIEAMLGPGGFAQHGLDALAQITRVMTEKRLAAGRALKDRKGELASMKSAEEEARAATERAEEQLARLATTEAGSPSKEAATEMLWKATAAKADLDAQTAAAKRAEAFVKGRREEAARLTQEASRVRAEAPALPTADELHENAEERRVCAESVKDAEHDLRLAEMAVANLERQLAEARETMTLRSRALDERHAAATEAARAKGEFDERREAHEAAWRRAGDLENRAARELEAIAEVGGEAPTEQAIADAARAVAEATEAVRRADDAERARTALRICSEARVQKTAQVDHAAEMHTKLDAAVKALSIDVPRQLLAGVEGLAGLALDGDTILVPDHTGTPVDLDRLSTAAQMKFCLDIARRLNAKSKLLLVDGLERLDPANLRTFVAMATEGGYQLFATRVTEGPLVVRPLGGAS